MNAYSQEVASRLSTNMCRLQALSDAIGTIGEARQEGCETRPGTLQVLGLLMDELLDTVEADIDVPRGSVRDTSKTLITETQDDESTATGAIPYRDFVENVVHELVSCDSLLRGAVALLDNVDWGRNSGSGASLTLLDDLQKKLTGVTDRLDASPQQYAPPIQREGEPT